MRLSAVRLQTASNLLPMFGILIHWFYWKISLSFERERHIYVNLLAIYLSNLRFLSQNPLILQCNCTITANTFPVEKFGVLQKNRSFNWLDSLALLLEAF